jgi:hypothetical protein
MPENYFDVILERRRRLTLSLGQSMSEDECRAEKDEDRDQSSVTLAHPGRPSLHCLRSSQGLQSRQDQLMSKGETSNTFVISNSPIDQHNQTLSELWRFVRSSDSKMHSRSRATSQGTSSP